MKRLTTDNPEGNFETMLNYAYAKDSEVVLRFAAGKKDISLCDYMEIAAKNQCEGLKAEDYMEGACIECDCACPFGILYAVATQAAELRSRLMEYEDREEISTSAPAVPKYSKIKYNHHLWKKGSDGQIDTFAYECGFCNGPVCLRCGESFCHHCNPECYDDECVVEGYACPSCGEIIALEGCNNCQSCGQALDWRTYNEQHTD